MSIKKNKNQLIISIIVGVAIFAISYQIVVQQQRQIDELKHTAATQSLRSNMAYLIANTDLKSGQKISDSQLETKKFQMEIEGTFTNVSEISGLTLIKDVKEGALITTDCFKSVDIKISQDEPRPGYRAVATTIPNSSYAPFIKKGVYVDVYTEMDSMRVQNVRILGVDDNTSKSAKIIMLEIKQKDVRYYLQALSNDKPVIVQKNQHEDSAYQFAFNVDNLNPPSGLVDASLGAIPESAPNEILISDDIPLSKNTTSHKSLRSNNNIQTVEFIQGSTKTDVGFD